MKVVENFVWLDVTHKAIEVFHSGLFELYALHDDNSESLIETAEDLKQAVLSGKMIAIEVGHL